jgi:hypothetical protein
MAMPMRACGRSTALSTSEPSATSVAAGTHQSRSVSAPTPAATNPSASASNSQARPIRRIPVSPKPADQNGRLVRYALQRRESPGADEAGQVRDGMQTAVRYSLTM